MDNRQFYFWQRWFTLANVMTLVIGLLVAFAGNSFFFDYHNTQSQVVFFDGTPFTPEVLRLKNWLFGIIGGSIVGFHVLLIFLSEYALRQRMGWAYVAAWIGLLSWFTIDTCISLLYGAAHNVLFINVPAIIMLGLPLLMLYRGIYPR